MKKLTGNGLWESSRMMLFEHRDAIIDKQGQATKQVRPMLDEQEVERLTQAISESMQWDKQISLVVFRPHSPIIITGVVTSVNSAQGTLHMQQQSDIVSIAFTDVITVSM